MNMRRERLMLQIRPYDDNASFRKLKHGDRVFHDAIVGVLKGETIFQVINPDGENYCLHYIGNNDWAMQSELYPKSKHLTGYPLYPLHLMYDENDTSKMSFDIFDGIRKVWFQEANEYTITVAKLLLAHTDICMTFADRRVSMFLPESERLRISDEAPDPTDSELLRVIDSFFPAPSFNTANQLDQVYCFHHIFFFQGLSDLPLEKIRYAEIVAPKFEGIGSILSVYARLGRLFDRYGIKTTIQAGSTRYSDSMLEKYFALRITPADSNEENTVYICNYFGAWISRLVGKACEAEYDVNCLDPAFRNEMDEYAEAVMGKKRMLGVLLRGSDFFTSDMTALAKPVKADIAIPIVQKWMEEDGYDGIVLATEDEDMLAGMREAFGSKLIAISQERFSLKQFGNVETIAEFEQETMDKDRYAVHIEDTTVNYFYAVYLLSKCESFIYSNICGGERLTHIFNAGAFKKELCIAQTLMKQ